MNIFEKIEDALIHFEDAGYKTFGESKISISDDRFVMSDRDENGLYEMLKKIVDDGSYELKHHIMMGVKIDEVQKFDKWVWINQEFKTAVSRVFSNLEDIDINVLNSKISASKINKIWEFKNLRDLAKKCAYYNGNNGQKMVSIAPTFHPEEGIVVYAREILTPSMGKNRFELFNNTIYKKDEQTSSREIKMSKTPYSRGDFYTLEYKTTVSLERTFGFVPKIEYFSNPSDVVKDNSSLNLERAHNIIAKLEIDFIK